MKLLRLLLICCVAALAAVAAAQEDAPQPEASISAEDAPPDAAIAARLRTVLAELGHGEVEVSVRAGVVTLSGETADPTVRAEIADLSRRVEGVVAVRNELVEAAELGERLDPALLRFRARLAQVATVLPLFAVALVVFLAVLSIGWAVARLRLWDRLAPNSFIAAIYRQAVRVVFGLAGLVVALDLLGATALLGTILGAAGIVGLAIGFAVRDTVENFIASVMLSLRQPFRPNDLVEIEGDAGRVIRLTSRATILLSLDGNHIRIPNAVVFKSRLVNFTRNPERRFVFDIGIDPEADLAATRQLAQQTVQALPFVLAEPEALTWIENITEAGVILRVTGWIDQHHTGFSTARGEAMRQVKAAIEAAGVSIPDTTYRIRLDTGAAASADGHAVPDRSPPEASPGESAAPAPGAPAAEVRRSEERALVSMVDAEQHRTDSLLSGDAPEE